MLVISRKALEQVWIGDALVTVLRDRGGRISLGIEAPRETKILRSELLPAQKDRRTDGDSDNPRRAA